MTDPQAALKELRLKHSFFVGIDSDGCAFDTMELKHKECFIPNTVYYYGLQSVSKYVREVAEFVNLYSEWRGINRFPGLKMTVDLLAARPEVERRGTRLRNMDTLGRFIESGKPLSNPSLSEEVATTGDPDLRLALEWSESVNRDIARMVHGVSPFPGVRECLEELSGRADMMVVSATPMSALKSEWEEHDLTRYVALLAGQEFGSKKETLAAAVRAGVSRDKMLVIGDAPGDLQAARANGCLFYPIVPGDEEASWSRLLEEGLEKFFSGRFAGEYELARIETFLDRLPSTPPWRQR